MTEPVPLEITVEDYDAMRRDGAKHTLLDVREPKEFAISALEGSLDIPMGDVPGRVDDLPRDETLVVICRTGNRSGQVVSWLRDQGFGNATNLGGGINAWAERIDTALPTY